MARCRKTHVHHELPPPLAVPATRVSLRISQALVGVRGIWLGCGIVLAVVWGGLFWVVEHDAVQRARQQESQVTLQAKGFAEYVALHLLLVDRVIINARDDYQKTGAFPSGAQVAPELGASAPILLEMGIADQTGSLVAGTVRTFQGKDISDRAYFRALAADPSDRLYLGQAAVAGRLTGKVGLPVARPVLSANGEFRGVIAANIDPLVLRRYFDASDALERGGLVVIAGSDDGIVRVRFSKNSVTSGESLLSSPAWKPNASEVSRTKRMASIFDGRERLIGIHQLGLYPLGVAVAVPTERPGTWPMPTCSSHSQWLWRSRVALIMLARSRARLEVEQQENIKHLAASRQKEQEANQMKSRFLASVSHELRTPLNSILGFSELIRDEASGPDTSKFAGLIHNSGRHLHTLVNTLLDLAKIEAGKMEVNLEDVDLCELLVTVTDTHRVASEKKGLALSLTMSPPGIIVVHTDRTKLVQVLNNVLHNAIKFTDSGRIDVTSFSMGDGVLIRVVDSGRGMADKDMARVFQRFNTVGHEPEHQKGSGLGLALSKSLMNLLGGTITLQSQSGSGTQVDIFLPKGE